MVWVGRVVVLVLFALRREVHPIVRFESGDGEVRQTRSNPRDGDVDVLVHRALHSLLDPQIDLRSRSPERRAGGRNGCQGDWPCCACACAINARTCSMLVSCALAGNVDAKNRPATASRRAVLLTKGLQRMWCELARLPPTGGRLDHSSDARLRAARTSRRALRAARASEGGASDTTSPFSWS